MSNRGGVCRIVEVEFRWRRRKRNRGRVCRIVVSIFFQFLFSLISIIVHKYISVRFHVLIRTTQEGLNVRTVIAAIKILISSQFRLPWLRPYKFTTTEKANFYTLVHGLEWCHSHLKPCHFQSALFLTDSQPSLTLLFSAPAFLHPKSFWDIWDLSSSLSSRVAISFQWVPGHAGLSGNELADSLAKTGATLPVAHVPCSLAPTIAKIRHTRYFLWRRNFSHNSLFCQIPSVSSEELAFPRLIR